MTPCEVLVQTIHNNNRCPAFCQQIDKYHIMLENCQRTEKIVNVPVTVPLVFISVRCNGDYVVVDDSEAGTLPTRI